MSKEAIIKKILDDANAKAEQIAAESRTKAEEISDAARRECEAQLVAAREELEKQSDETLSRAQTVAELDAKRLLLDARLNIIDRVFARALEKLVDLDDKAMKELLLCMLAEAAEDGDEVLLNARGRALLSEDDIKAFAKKRKISLLLIPADGDFSGGLLLRQEGVDKNLTFEDELALLRDRKEAEIAKQIFG